MNTPLEKKHEGLAAALDAVRKELLDLGLRNPLLNYTTDVSSLDKDMSIMTRGGAV